MTHTVSGHWVIFRFPKLPMYGKLPDVTCVGITPPEVGETFAYKGMLFQVHYRSNGVVELEGGGWVYQTRIDLIEKPPMPQPKGPGFFKRLFRPFIPR